MTALPTSGRSLVEVIPAWIDGQTLKSMPIAGYDPQLHAEVLGLLGECLIQDESIAAGKLSLALQALVADPQKSRAALTDEVFNGNSGYALQVLWPVIATFAGRIPRRISTSTANSYVGWLDRIRRASLSGLDDRSRSSIEQVLDLVSDAFSGAAGASPGNAADAAREAEAVSERIATTEPGIYVFTTPTYLAYPPLGWNVEDISRQDFRYLKTGSTTVDVHGRIQSEIRRQTGLPEPYLILAKFTATHEGADYPAVERQIHQLLNAARHGPEEDGTRRTSSRGAGTEWFITRLPFVIAIAESVGLRLSMTDEHKVSVNEVLEECELEDWMLS